MAKDDVITLCDPGVLGAAQLNRRETKSGGVRHSISIEATPLIHDLDEVKLALPVAQAMAQVLRTKIASIAAVASANTIRARRTAEKALSEGKAWAVKRYGGGKVGTRTPNQSNRIGSDSGRLAESIVAQPAKDGRVYLNVAANRFDPSTTSGEVGVRRIFEVLKRHVKELANPGELLNDKAVQNAVRGTLDSMIIRAEARRTQLTEAARNAKIQAVQSLLGLLG